MQLGDEIQKVRYFIGEPNNQGRFSDQELTSDINSARNTLMLDLEFPEATITTSTVGGTKEYALPVLQRILRCYLNGQRLLSTDIATMEGEQIQFYDQSVAITYQPQWVAAAAQNYPVASPVGFGYPMNNPWPNQGSRPKYYRRSGVIGFQPTPAAVYTVQLDIIPVAPALVNSTDVDIFPDNWIEAIAWGAAEIAKFADSMTTGSDTTQADKCRARYEAQVMKLRSSVKRMDESWQYGPIVLTYRSFFPVVNAQNGFVRGQDD